MRRTIAAAAVALSAVLSVVPAVGSSASDGATPVDPTAGPLAQLEATRALATARQVLSGAPGDSSSDSPVEGTLAMRDLFAALPALSVDQRRQARTVLARPTDGNRDPYGDGYTVSARRECRGHFCLHWVPTTSDAPRSRAWVDKTLRTMNQVWSKEVDGLGYRHPVHDGRHGGNNLFDVYLKDTGAQQLYGYCAPEYFKPGRTREASGYCVLDNDFRRGQFGGARPVNSLRVTAAHEFFHAIQFGYDYKEDPWMMEATATWMEERFADSINDNRQYLPYGQVRRPSAPLDVYDQQGFNQYGNWPFFEFLSSRYGNDIVRQVWNAAGEFPDGGKTYSAKAIGRALRQHGGFASVYAHFAAANLSPVRSYAEGDHWPSAAISQHWKLSKAHRHGSATFSVNHMAARNAVLTPDTSLAGSRWRARVVVDAPGRAKSPEVLVVVHPKQGRAVRKTLALSDTGVGRTSFGFSASEVRRVTITAANASRRFHCRQGTYLSCRGTPLDNNSTFQLKVTAFQG